MIRAAANPWSYFYFGSLIGTAKKPIVIINEGTVEVTAGFDIEHSQYVKITGSGSRERYGFRIKGSSGTALSIHGKSAHIEAERFYVEDCTFGCWIKNEADCDTSVNNWVLDQISIHDFEMRKIRIEGMYMGSTDPNNFSRPKNCNGQMYHYRPSRLGNIKVFNGKIDGTGRPAIMLSNASVGLSEIYNNVVTNVGLEYNDQQGTGIAIGGYTRAFVHHNTVRNTYTWGIASLGGSGLVRIENNTVDSSGYLHGRSLNWPQNIVIDTRPTNPVDSTRFLVKNNRVSNPGASVKNIEVWSTLPTYGRGNIICNNTEKGKPARLGIAPGVRWADCNGKTTLSTGSGPSSWLYIGIGGTVVLAALLAFRLIRRRRIRPHARDGMSIA